MQALADLTKAHPDSPLIPLLEAAAVQQQTTMLMLYAEVALKDDKPSEHYQETVINAVLDLIVKVWTQSV